MLFFFFFAWGMLYALLYLNTGFPSFSLTIWENQAAVHPQWLYYVFIEYILFSPNVIALVDPAWTIFSIVFGQNAYAEQFAWKYFHPSFLPSKHESCLSFSLNVESVLFGFMFLKIKTNLRKGIVCLTWSVDLFRVVVLGNLKSSLVCGGVSLQMDQPLLQLSEVFVSRL